MSSLAELPNLIGFFSYSRNDDEGDNGAVSALANRIFLELRAQLGRNNENPGNPDSYACPAHRISILL